MCGICGYTGKNAAVSRDELLAMNQALLHRGPDAGDVWTERDTGLGNRRLKIIDLSDLGNQPMHSACGRYVMVYNGEVYNYAELGAGLVKEKNIRLRSGSDTEVILELFAAYGKQSLGMLNGMFALAIYDRREQKLYLTRDRSGIKPLYYYYDTSGKLVFTSEISAFRKVKSLPLDISRDILPVYLHLGFVPAPWSIYRNIYKVRPGTVIETDGSFIQEERFHSFIPSGKEELMSDEKEAAQRLEELMLSSVKYQLRSDVPVGIFLSGGTDSSLLAAIAVKVHNEKVNTFTIGFRENRFDESAFAEKVAKELGTNHHSFIVSADDATGMMEKLTDVYGEPFADSSAIPTMIVSELARRHVSVTLSGEGGDELFYGYGSYRWAARLSDPVFVKCRHAARMLLSLSGGSRNRRVAEMFRFDRDTYLPSHIFSQEQYFFSDKDLRQLLHYHPGILPGHFLLFENRLQESKRRISPMEAQALYDLDYYLPGDLLAKVDRASMHFSLETRVPYLDHRIVEFACNLHENLKVRNGTSKYILKKLLFRYLSPKLFERPKQGFTIPLHTWMRDRWEFMTETYLSKKVVERYGVVKNAETERLLHRYRHGKEEYLYNRIWSLIMLHRWMERFHG